MGHGGYLRKGDLDQAVEFFDEQDKTERDWSARTLEVREQSISHFIQDRSPHRDLRLSAGGQW